MDISLFRRGIRLQRRPAFGPVKEISPPRRVVLIPGHELQKHYKQLVKASEIVSEGDPIAITDNDDVLCAPIGGEVKSLGDILCADGRRIPALAIETVDAPADAGGPAHLDGEDFMRRAGVGYGAPRQLFADVLDRAQKAGTKHLVIRFFDADPYVGALEAITAGLESDVSVLKRGIDIVKERSGASSVQLVLEKAQAGAHIEKLASDIQARTCRVNGFEYPNLSDALLARDALGSDATILPSEVYTSGALVVDVSTIIEVAHASEGQGVTTKTITVWGGGVAAALRVTLGSSIGDILDAAGAGREFAKIVLGGPLTGQACHDLDYPLTGDVNAITLFAADDLSIATDHPCISCGLCNMTCPMRLVPGMLSRYCEYDDLESAKNAHLFSCIECGCCAYVCPAERSMVQLFSHGKKELRAQKEA